MNKSKTLRKLLAGPEFVRIIGAHDGLSARLIEDAGFDAIWASSLGISAVHALPDADILTMTQYLQATDIMNAAVRLPILADCNAGFGNVNNIVHLIHEYERHGIAGVCIEDKVFPKTNSLSRGNQLLISTNEFVDKLRHARLSRSSRDFVLVARVEALIADLGLDEALERALAYTGAGADAIVIHSKATGPEEVKQFMSRWPGHVPVIVIPTMYPNVEVQELRSLGVQAAIYANQGLRVSIRGMKQVFTKLYSSTSPACVENEIATLEEVFQLQRVNDWINI